LSMTGGADKRDFYCPSFVGLFEAAERMLDADLEDFIKERRAQTEQV
jgi:hypothetical protein